MKVNFRDKTVGGFNYELTRGISIQNAGAAEFGECMETMERVKDNDFDSWIREWEKTADHVMEYALRQQQNGDKISARKAFLRASNYYRMACFYAVHTDPRHRGLWEKSVTAFHHMAELSEHPVERVEIPFGNARLPGYYIPSGLESRPTLIAIGGFDSTKEEVYCWVGEAARAYGWNCLIFEGPGQWGALMDHPGLVFQPDYEKPVGAAVDFLMARDDIDKEKIAIIGYSMGGYLSVRGTFDQRIKACIPNTLVVDCGASARAGMKGMVKYEALMDKAFNFLMKINTPARWGFQHSAWTL
ncbi:MAG: esterase FrsA, partial [Peptococcaceae bacterium]|nr:esterase FrsA [Peptococcaceae bacterium]